MPRPRRYFRWTDEAKAYLADLLSGPPCTDQFLCDALTHKFDRPVTVGGVREMMLRSGYKRPGKPPPKPRSAPHWHPNAVARMVDLFVYQRKTAVLTAKIMSSQFGYRYTPSMVANKSNRCGHAVREHRPVTVRVPGPLTVKRRLRERLQRALAQRSV